MLVVHVEKPADQTLPAWFAELREWFDVNRCEPVGFFRAGRLVDRVIYQISFQDAETARRFAAHFRKYAAAVRRATLDERARLNLTKALAEAAQ